MHILLANDDGYKAKGINVLKEVLNEKFQTTMIAPNQERSSCGHGISLAHPIRVEKIEDNVFNCSGLPADCILIGLGALLKDSKPDVIVSGINHGANLGQDRYYSGTIAAAREGSFRGIPSIAVSLVNYFRTSEEHYHSAAKFIQLFIENKLHELIPQMCVVNINVPNLAWENISGVKVSSPGFQLYSEEVIEREDGRGKKYYWLGGCYEGHRDIEQSDCNVVSDGFISVDLQYLSGSRGDYSQFGAELIEKINGIKWQEYGL